jgi:hypothetical protein
MTPDSLPVGSIEREVCFLDGSRESLLLTPLGENRFRMDESSMFGEVMYRDVIEAIETEGGVLRFVAVVEKSPLTSRSWISRQELIETDAIQNLLRRIMDEGGNWEQTFGGVLTVHLPRGKDPRYLDRPW